MPNYVESKLVVSGKGALAFRAENGGLLDLDFSIAVPYPEGWNAVQKGEDAYVEEEYGSIDGLYGEEYWFPWRNRHWGTLSNPRDVEVTEEEGVEKVVYTSPN